LEADPVARVAINLQALQTDFVAVAAAAAAAAPKPMVITVGCLADFHSNLNVSGQPYLPCLLGDVSIRNNTFSNLTWPIYASADLTTARVQDNNATNCVAGYWFELAYSQAPQGDILKQFGTVMNAIEAFGEEIHLQGLAPLYPLPTAPLLIASPPDALRPTTTASFFITNNQMEALPSVGQGSVGLLLYANRPIIENVDTSASLIISANRFSNQSLTMPTVLLTVADLERCAVTGNLIFNQSHRPGSGAVDAQSLIIIPNSPVRGAHLLAVTGNAFLGPTDLDEIFRIGVLPDTWSSYNATER